MHLNILLIFLLFTNVLFSNDINSLLQEYKNTNDKSLQTVNEKSGHVVIYSKKELKLMQYTNLSDILKELPMLNYNQNRYGLSNPSLVGTKTAVSGFFRFFINDHEVSSVSSTSSSLSWGDMPLDFIDHIEIYYGDSSFSLGNETGIYFIRMYTKDAQKENAGQIKVSQSNKNSSSQSFMHSESFANGWSYLLFASQAKSEDDFVYDNNILNNKENKRYVYLDINNDTTKINIGFTDVKKDNFVGLSLDAVSDSGKIEASDYFISLSKYFLEDKSLKANISYSHNNTKYSEKNSEGIAYLPVINLSNFLSIPKEFEDDTDSTKTNFSISKEYKYKNHKIVTSLNFTNKVYTVNNREMVNFIDEVIDIGDTSDFDEENTYSLAFEDDYKINEDLVLISNIKVNKYERAGSIDDSNDVHFRVGAIYTPFDNFGLKSFYTQTTLPLNFYNVNFADSSSDEITSQEYKYYTLEGVFTSGKSKFGLLYNNVRIKDFIYLTPIGFINVDHIIRTQGLIFNYEYDFNAKNKLHLNYYISKLSEELNNASKGGYVKFMGEYKDFTYFTSLIYRNSYTYSDVKVDSSFNLSLGSTYNITKDLSFSAKGENLLDKSTSSLYEVNFDTSYFAIEDYQRKVTFALKWVF